MSSKNGKRTRRRTDEELLEFKAPPSIKKDANHKAEDAVKSKVEEPKEKSSVAEEVVACENNGKSEEGIKTRTRSNTPQSPKASPQKLNDQPENKKEETSPSMENKSKKTEAKESDAKEEVETKSEKEVEVINEASKSEITESNGVQKELESCRSSQESDEIDMMEPLILDPDSEGVDPELEFDENSDIESHKGSPVLSRCRTRRSQTRNIPTPRTPKSVTETNGDDKDSDKLSTATPDIIETPDIANTPDITENTELQSECSQKTDEDKIEPELISMDLNETRESFESAVSTKVHVGSDLTREIDLTLPDDKDSFLNQTKDLTVVETIRRMSSRRAIRSTGDYRKTLLKSQTGKLDLSMPYSSRSSVEKLTGMKRKNRSETPDGVKRFKPDHPPTGFLSYISSPINKIKNKFTTGEVSASTPKLTSYRKQDILEDAEFSKIENEINAPEKKWCSIM